jgi:hypothetical protein
MYLEVFKAGSFAKIDFSVGLIPCKVIEVIEEGEGHRATGGKIKVKVTKGNQFYRSGETLLLSAFQVIPSDKVKIKRGKYVIKTNYVWAKN